NPTQGTVAALIEFTTDDTAEPLIVFSHAIQKLLGDKLTFGSKGAMFEAFLEGSVKGKLLEEHCGMSLGVSLGAAGKEGSTDETACDAVFLIAKKSFTSALKASAKVEQEGTGVLQVPGRKLAMLCAKGTGLAEFTGDEDANVTVSFSGCS